jgi:hypothetical protein
MQFRQAEDLPKDVERYVEEGKAQGLPENQAWAVAWSRYCKYKNPGSDHCQKSPSEYFPGRKASNSVESTAARVAIRHLAAVAAGSKILPKDRQKINAALIRAGLDGNTRFQSPGMALAKVNEILQVFGIEWDEVINAHSVSRPKGNLRVDLATSTPGDPFSPVSVTNTTLAFFWDTLETGIEAIAYLG